MSELKAVHAFDVYEAYTKTGDDDAAQVYIKSEADKAIAELEKKLDIYKRGWMENDKVNANQYAEIRHQKYKRCLAMARWCEDKVDAIKNGYIVSSIETRDGVMTTCPPECNPKFSFYSKWQKRYLKIAEQFKEVK